MVGIYKITSPSGKVYIGQSWNLKKRISGYKSIGSSNQKMLHASFLKHGTQKHEFSIIHNLPPDIEQSVLDEYECIYMQLYKQCGIRLLNIRDGGSHGKQSEESKVRNREAQTGKKASEEARKKMSIAHLGNVSNTGKKASEETMKGRKKSEDHRLKLFGKTGPKKGRRHHPDTIIKMREAAKNRYSIKKANE